MARKIIKRRRHRPVRVSSVEKSSDGETVIVTVVYREKSGHVRVRRMREPVVQFGNLVGAVGVQLALTSRVVRAHQRGAREPVEVAKVHPVRYLDRNVFLLKVRFDALL